MITKPLQDKDRTVVIEFSIDEWGRLLKKAKKDKNPILITISMLILDGLRDKAHKT